MAKEINEINTTANESIEERTPQLACIVCGQILTDADGNDVLDYICDVEGNAYCEECAESYLFYCDHCGEYYDVQNDCKNVVIDERGCELTWCEDCVANHSWECEDCGTVYSDEVNPYVLENGRTICEYCLDEGMDNSVYVQCEDCGIYLYSEDAFFYDGMAYCHDCVRRRRGVIYGYHDYHPEWNFLGNDTTAHCVMGVELEIDEGGEDSIAAVEITRAGGFPADSEAEKPDPMYICSHDGSLDNGFEIISQPATLSFHTTAYKDGFGYNWEALMEKALDLGYRSHDPGTCGLHVHINRSWFENASVPPEMAISILVMNNAEWLTKFSRRKRWGYCQFPSPEHFTSEAFETPESELFKDAIVKLRRLNSFFQGHGSALNFNNPDTIEIRFFRGTLNYHTFVASLQLVDMMTYAMRHFDLIDLAKVNFNWFANQARKLGYVEFSEYSESRGIKEE